MSGEPDFSVIVPAFEVADTLSETLDSLRSQDLTSWEAIVVDDGSTDGTWDLAWQFAQADPRIRLVRQPNRGLSAARNTGVLHSRGRYVSFLDADDLLTPTALHSFARFLDRHGACGAVHAAYTFLDPDGGRSPASFFEGTGDLFEELCQHNLFPVHAAAIRRSYFRHAAFDPALRSCEDWDLWLQVCRLGCSWGHCADALAVCRMRPASMSRNASTMYRAGLEVIRRGMRPDLRLPGFAAGIVCAPAMAARAHAEWAVGCAAVAAAAGDYEQATSWVCERGADEWEVLSADRLVSIAYRSCLKAHCLVEPGDWSALLHPLVRLLVDAETRSGRRDLLPALLALIQYQTASMSLGVSARGRRLVRSVRQEVGRVVEQLSSLGSRHGHRSQH